MSRALASAVCALVIGGLFVHVASADMVEAPPPDMPVAAPPPPVQGAPSVMPPNRRPPPQPPQPPPVSPLIAAEATALAGTWTCKGVQIAAAGSSTPETVRLTSALVLDGAYVHLTFDSGTAKLEIYRTFDSVSKQWSQMVMSNDASHVMATSLGEQNGTWTWDGTLSSQTGTLQVRDSEQRSPTSIKMWGEQLLGGTWTKVYDMTCTKP
jgi:hypothetical protein|nr:hypothetical protein [Kofleriaceae bacterium]